MSSNATPTQVRRPLCVDLDTVLLDSGLTLECLAETMRQPQLVWRLPFWALRGTAHLKRQMALHCGLNASQLAYRPEALARVQSHSDPEEIHLVTTADELVARQVAAYLGLSEDVVASGPAG